MLTAQDVMLLAINVIFWALLTMIPVANIAGSHVVGNGMIVTQSSPEES
ncbi:MAG: hypothetical protein ACKPJO_02830 [Dolichospermum sp.]